MALRLWGAAWEEEAFTRMIEMLAMQVKHISNLLELMLMIKTGLVLVAVAALIWWCVIRCCGVCRVVPAAAGPPVDPALVTAFPPPQAPPKAGFPFRAVTPPRPQDPARPRAVGAAQGQEAAVAGAAADTAGAAADPAVAGAAVDVAGTAPPVAGAGAAADPAVVRAVVAAVARAAATQAPATPAPKAPPQQQMPPVPQMGPHRRNKRVTPEVGWRELHQCARLGHSLLAGRNHCSVYITCQVCRKHASWRKGDIPTFQHSQPLNERLRHHWAELNGHVVQG